jgi:glycosyltransferase involved in cell wall biosynthesis
MHYRVSVYNNFLRRFQECGWEFIVRSDEIQRENPYPLLFDFRVIPFNFLSYKREIESIRPDAVILFLHLKDLIIWPLLSWLKMKRIPVIFWTKGANLDAPEDGVSYALYRFTHGKFDRMILYSENERKYIREKFWQRVYVATNTINFEDFPDIVQSKEEIKKEFRIPFEKVVLSVGRMGAGNQRKKIDHLIEIFQDPGWRGTGLVIVGSGVTADIRKRMNGSNTVYLGEVHDPANVQISKIFKMSDVFSIPGHVGLGLNQAFYFGLPVVTEDGGQPPEIHYLVDGRNGFIVPNNDIAELKRKIKYLVENDEIRKVFGENAKSDIQEHASMQNMFLGFKNCLDSI